MGNKTVGYIYILTNPAFPQYVKIGFATDMEHRLRTLNSSPSLPMAFRVYATYEVESALSDKKLHTIIDTINPDLRTIDNVNGKNRVREFYAMSAKDAYAIFEAIAEINNRKDMLKKYALTAADKANQKSVKEAQEMAQPFKFSFCGIKPGEKIEWENDPTLDITVVDDKKVEYNKVVWSLSALAKYLKKSKYGVAGPRFFKYKGQYLNDIRESMDK